MRVAVFIGLLSCVACTSEPRANAHVRVTPDGVRVVPVLSGVLNGVGVSVSP